jgi:membrane protease YdiL (CAAX protease family)
VVLTPALDPAAAGADPAVSAATQVTLGVVAGVVLFLGTRVFVAVAVRVAVFAQDVGGAYGRAAAVPRSTAIALSVFVTSVGEELFWRGLVYRVSADLVSSIVIAAIVCWMLYVVANLPSRLLPIIAAAVVGGALWTALAWWTGGVLAPIASHMLWTGLMLGFPPGPPGAEVT